MSSTASKARLRLRRWLLAVAIVGIALPGGYFMARHYAWPAYKEWREAKYMRMAQDFLAAGDYDNALLTARRVLRDNQRSIPNWKLAAAAAKAKGTSDVIYYQQNLTQLEGTLANQLELIRLALQFGDSRRALDTIENIDPSARTSTEFHALAAQTYLRMGRPTAAKTYLYSLIDLRPQDGNARLDLAEIELDEDPAGKNTKLRDDLVALSREPALRVRALTLLLADALTRKDPGSAAKYARELAQSPQLTGVQRVQVLAGLTAGAPREAEVYRAQLQQQIAGDPAAVVALATFYRDGGPMLEARQWFDSLPPETRRDVGVQEAIAAAFLAWKDWTRLDQAINTAQWGERDFMREAFTAYSARRNGRLADAGNAWRLAVIQAGDSVRKTSELLALVARWGWQTEQYDLVWKLFALMPRNESISRQLIAWERQQGRTANLNRIFARLMEFSGDDRMIKNNFAYSSLLLDSNLSKAAEIARTNYQAEPANPYYVSTQALALYKQDKPADALALLETLRPSALITPERTLLHALFRARTGDASGAADLLAGLRTVGFLPEERQLLARTGQMIAQVNREKGDEVRLNALVRHSEADAGKGWLQALPTALRSAATPEMQMADSLYALGDRRALGEQLRKTVWGEWDYLRQALIAYTTRSRNDDVEARSYWRTAVGSAAGSLDKLHDLESLANLWNWRPEKMDVQLRLYATDGGNEAMFTELMTYFRENGRTADLVTVLSTYMSMRPNAQAQACELAYYRMLSGVSLARAYVTAQEVFTASPEDPTRRKVYAFALWKQRRPREAWELLEPMTADTQTLVPLSLLRAAVLADLERREDAAEALRTFDRAKALPEEASLAALVAGRLKAEPRLSRAD